ncbi:MAG: SEC-C domain-containing protein, partial [Prevotella sp.]|nr:SEC-C domain-containing protein [Prevotella sp.]
SPIGILQLLIDASPSSKKLKDINDIEPIVQVVMDYLNHSPRWIFYGHCPNDLGSSEQMIEPDDFDAFIPYVTASTTEPNAPCPCGSGKKFKDCCGRGN